MISVLLNAKNEFVTLKEVENCIFTIFGILTMAKEVNDHGLIPIWDFCPRVSFLSEKFYTFRNFIFSLFTGLYITYILL
jgi:hypothetical protein